MFNRLNGKSQFLCFFITIIAIPIWFFILVSIWFTIRDVDCPAGVFIYWLLCLISAIPIGLLNAFFIAPRISKPLKITSSYGIPFLINGIVFLCIAGVIACWSYVLTLDIGVSVFTLLTWYMLQFLIPPIIIGSVVYSFCYLKSLKKSIILQGAQLFFSPDVHWD